MLIILFANHFRETLAHCMFLQIGGMNVFYIDESHDNNHYVVTAVCVPFLRQNGVWQIVWPDYLEGAKTWRKKVALSLSIPRSKELHGVKLASCRGNFLKGKHNFKHKQAVSAYSNILADLDFLPDESIMSVVSSRAGSTLYGHQRLEAAMYALFQRMRRKCVADRVNAITFFDQGHPEYRKLYRMAQIFLPTGSQSGDWGGGKPSKNMPMSMFIKDANEKNSKHCFFTQIADLVAYAAFMKIKGENNQLTPWQSQYSFNDVYDSLPKDIINSKVSYRHPHDGILRLK